MHTNAQRVFSRQAMDESQSGALDPRSLSLTIEPPQVPQPRASVNAASKAAGARSTSTRARRKVTEQPPKPVSEEVEEEQQKETSKPATRRATKLAKNGAASPPVGADDDDSNEGSDDDPDWEPSGDKFAGKRMAARARTYASSVTSSTSSQSTATGSPKKKTGSQKGAAAKKANPYPDKTFWCYSCDRGFSRSADKDRHLETYHKLQGLPCTICKGTFSRADALRRHLLKGCSGKARKRRSRAWELAAQRNAQSGLPRPPAPPELVDILLSRDEDSS